MLFDPIQIRTLSLANRAVMSPMTRSRAVEANTPNALMAEADIAHAVGEYAKSATLAIQAGFDGIELHAANGYPIEQFLNANVNQRTDRYGGSPQNRNRFALEVARATTAAIGADKVGIRLSPYGVFNGTGPFADVDAQYKALAEGLSSLGLLYVHVLDHSAIGAPAVPAEIKTALRAAFDGPFILAGVKTDAITNELDMDSFYTPGAKGYTDYPAQA